jgi:NADPH-dependent 2,4-dienoyl-CoA reductase/sulfur reductase-like enzyme
MHAYDYLVIGGGMTADAAAHGIREVDTTGSIGIISNEEDAPYSRPPLSKALWKGEPERSVWKGTESIGVTLHLERSATTLDAAARKVTDDKGDQYQYRSLLLATGATPRHFTFPDDGVVYYRTLRDYRRLRALADKESRFVVIGGGFIGSEIAAALRMNERDVVMIIPESGISARVFPADLARFLVDYYRQKGVDVHTDATVSGMDTASGKTTVRTSARSFVGDSVVAGIGVVPNVVLASQAGIETKDGIPVDDRLRTSRDGVYAAGDVASFMNTALGVRQRVEHEDNALTMGKAAGRSMAGDATRYHHTPFFYSDLFDLGYEAVGVLDSRLETFADWKDPFREGVVYYLGDGRVRGVLLWNTWGQVDAARALIEEPRPVKPESLRGRLPAS